MERYIPFVPFAFIGSVVGYLAYRYFRFGGFVGMSVGARVLRTIGSVESERNLGIKTGLAVHVLERELGAPSLVAIGETSKGLASWKFRAFKLTPDQARALAHLLETAAKG
jgi:hypothetical protein